MTDKTKGMLAAVAAVVVWSTTYALVKVGMGEISPMLLAVLRSLVASIVLLVIIVAQQKTNNIVSMFRKHFFIMVILGLTGTTLFQFFQNMGLVSTTSSLTSILINTDPLFIGIFAVFFLHENLTWLKAAGVLIGFLGICIVILDGGSIDSLLASDSLTGNLYIICAALSWSVYSIITKKILKHHSPLLVTAFSLSLGSLFLIMFSLVVRENWHALFSIGLVSWIVLLYLGVVSALGGLLWNYALSKLPVYKAALYLYLIPVFSIGIGIVFFQEHLTIYHLAGGVLVFLGLYLAEKEQRSTVGN